MGNAVAVAIKEIRVLSDSGITLEDDGWLVRVMS